MVEQFAGQNPRINSMMSSMQDIVKDPDFKTYSPDVQQMMLFGGVLGSQQSQVPSEQDLERMGRFREQEARRAQELGKESVQEAFKYSTLANIPKTIAQSFGNIAAMNVLGARNATEAMAQTLASYPRASFPAVPYQPQKYFS
jgi:muconolactone delta-isomerase